MATNPSNSNAINISNLPQAQLLVDGDLLIAETLNGTQVIDFQNLNLVKTDVFGNATVTGDLTAKNALLSNIRVTSISALDVYTPAGQGTNSANDFYDRFTIQNGIVLSASQNFENNPIYRTITGSILPATTGYLLTLFQRVADETGTPAVIAANTVKSSVITINNFFAKYPWVTNVGFLKPNNFILMPSVAAVDNSAAVFARTNTLLTNIQPAGTAPALQNAFYQWLATMPGLTAQPVLPVVLDADIQQSGNNLSFAISLPYTLPTSVSISWRIIVTG